LIAWPIDRMWIMDAEPIITKQQHASDLGHGANSSARNCDDLAREVYGLFGIPIDIVDMPAVLQRIENAAAGSAPYFVSTPNLNFLVASRTDPEFRESLLRSDLCPADGMPVVWLARLLGVPLKERIAGSDIFEALKSRRDAGQRLAVFLFGGAKGVAASACQKLNNEPGNMTCVGHYDPGFCTVDEMSSDRLIETVNSSGANFLVVALGARKGQAWLLRNLNRLRIPVRVHLGAVINFQAGAVKRAPIAMRKFGLEWLWRIWQEPQLWQRYWGDFTVLCRLVLTQVVPLMFIAPWNLMTAKGRARELDFDMAEGHKSVILSIKGAAIAQNAGQLRASFQDLLAVNKNVVINCSDISFIDPRFLGLLLMLNKEMKKRQLQLTLTGVPSRIERLFRLNGFEFLLRVTAESVA
jgi:N-acetylglucosaminyldiphosphoundecaprenol N-acetyl-beta-D-mannosaminyltransferase